MAIARRGDLIEIETPNGIGYGLFTHKHSKYGELLRVFNVLVDERPRSPVEILDTAVRFNCFFPVSIAIRRKSVSVAFHCNVPEGLSVFPLFRTGVPSPLTKRIERWSLWDGEKSWQIGVPNKDEAKISPLAGWNHALLVHRISNGWRPEMWI
ncbi:hypothetical protein SAMN04488073_2574 [Marinobacter gudaonensis]|uniref:Immunity protein 26 n=1 Tax=Marinobacter gudaonensis TaxID=375760 RepID=A0A1I6HA65_9GAMM|nr:hypothetical protein SAMN04488073_2574 [Marinobacter gudaonensis]